MCEIKFYLLPSNCYGKIIAGDIFVLDEIITGVKLKDRFLIPVDFYDQSDENNVTAYEYLYGMEQNDASTYLLDIVSKEAHTDNTYEMIDGKNNIGYVAFASDHVEQEKEKICVYRSKEDIIKVKRFYIMGTNSYEEYIMWIRDCFPGIVFYKNAFNSIEKLGRFHDIKNELQRHLIVLSDHAKSIYYQCDKKEEEAFAVLKSKYGIFCSGKGSKEETVFKVDYFGIKITCNPHTKLFTEYSDKRIYFCWGRDDIENHNIIVARIGNHWE